MYKALGWLLAEGWMTPVDGLQCKETKQAIQTHEKPRREELQHKMTRYVPEMQTTPEIANLWPRHSNWTFNNISDVINVSSMQLRSRPRPYLHTTQSNRQPSVGSERVRRSPMFCVQYLGDFSTDSNHRPTDMHSVILSQISIRGIWYSAATVNPTQRLPLTVGLLRSPLCRRGSWPKIWVAKKEPGIVFSYEVLP